MPQLSYYPSSQLPLPIKYQLLSFVRIEWWWFFEGDNLLWDYTDKDTHPINFVIVEQDVLISHAEANWRYLDHAGQSFKVYGISGVFTYPAFRKQGYGNQVVEAASQYIQSSDGDIAMLFCLPHLVNFYSACGWVSMSNTQIQYGSHDKREVDDEEALMMLFVSERGQQARSLFEHQAVFVGESTW